MDGRRNSGSSSTCTPAPISGNNSARLMIESCPPCDHYERNCSIIAPCCGACFGCRICHDECPVLPPERFGVQRQEQQTRRQDRSTSLPASWTSMPEPESHNIDRFAIREVICRKCFTRQSSKTDTCIQCGVLFGEYHCNICNLWMSNGEKPYHCNACGFCRVG